MTVISMLINGASVQATGGATFERRNPLDGTVATTAPAATVADAVAAADAAAKAFPAWSALGPNARRALLLKAAHALESKVDAFAAAMAAETGASGMWAGFNVHLAAGLLQEAAALTTQIAGEVIPSDVPGSLAMGVRQAAGVVLGIAPWNAPIILGVRAIATPLACGNTVILKGSELCPATHGLIIEALQEAGLPPGVVNFVTNAPADAGAVVEAIVAHPAVRRVNFTGSTKVGRIIAQTCAKYLKPVVLELGGKAPLLVLDDADIDAAVAGTVFGAFANSGQICMSTERIIVDNAVADEFVAKLGARAKALPLGDPRKGPVVLGSVVDMSHRAPLQRHDRRRAGQGRQAGLRRQERQHADAGHRARPRDGRDGHLPRRIIRPGQARGARERRGRSHCLRQRQRVRPLVRRVQPRCGQGVERGGTHRVRHLPRQWPHRARRRPDAVWRREEFGLRPLWRHGRGA